MIDIEFFQAAATVIPTLLVAVVFTSKILDSWKLELYETTNHEQQHGRIADSIEGITFVDFLLLVFIAGEGAALAALTSDVPHFHYLVMVVVAISFQLTCLGGIVLLQAVSLTLDRVIRPLRDLRLVALLLAGNFIAVPAVAILASRVLPMDDTSAAAIILIGACAGAPFLPKLARLAKGDLALSVGEMVLLMVATVLYAPLVVPLVIAGATVQPWDIASSLVLLMLIPLGIGLFVRARHTELAAGWAGPAGRAANVALLLGLGAALLVTWRDVLGAIGSWIFVGTAIVLAAGLLAGYLAAWNRPRGDVMVSALATAQRNLAVAVVIAFSLGGDVVVLTLVGALVIPIVLIILAGELGRRTAGPTAAA